MSINTKIALLLLIIISSQKYTSSQNSKLKNIDTIVNYAETKYGVNDLLVNGKIYFPLHQNVIGHPFYRTDEFVNADIYIKNNVFKDVPLKYDIEQQKMIIQNVNSENSMRLITLNPLRIDSIIIKGSVFLPSDRISKLLPNNRYYEILWNKKFHFVIYHYIKFDPNKNRQSSNPGKYIIVQSEKILVYQDKIIRVNNKKFFLNHFKPTKKKINHFMTLNNIKYSKADISQLKQLIQFCYENQ